MALSRLRIQPQRRRGARSSARGHFPFREPLEQGGRPAGLRRVRLHVAPLRSRSCERTGPRSPRSDWCSSSSLRRAGVPTHSRFASWPALPDAWPFSPTTRLSTLPKRSTELFDAAARKAYALGNIEKRPIRTSEEPLFLPAAGVRKERPAAEGRIVKLAATIFLTLLTLCSTVRTTAASEPLYPDSLLNWLRIIDSDDLTLLCASNQHGFYFAVKLDSDGDIVFCHFNHSNEPIDNPRQFSLVVRDADGNDLHDIDSNKRSPSTVKIEYSEDSHFGPIKTSSSATIAYSRGVTYPLRTHNHKVIRICYVEILRDGTKKILFDQVMHLPQARDNK